MEIANFYLIDSLDISKVNEAQKMFIDNCLSIYHKPTSSIIDQISAINELVENKQLGEIRYTYNTLLHKLIKANIQTATTVKEKHFLEKVLANCYHQFGIMYYTEGDYDQSLDNYTQSLKIRKLQNDKAGLLKSYNNLGLIHNIKGNVTASLEYYQKSAELCQELNDDKSLAIVYNNMGFILTNQSNYLSALDYIHKSLAIKEKDNDEEGMAKSYHNIGNIFGHQEEWDKAWEYYTKAMNLYQKIDHKHGITEIHRVRGMIHQRKQEYEAALSYFNKALAIQKKENLKEAITFTYISIADIYQIQNKPKLALESYYTSLRLREEMGNKRDITDALNNIGLLEIELGNITTANQQIERAFTLAQELNYPPQIKDAAKARARLAVLRGDYKLAYEMTTLAYEIREQMQSERKQKAILKQQFKYEYDNALLKKDLEIEFEKKNASLIKKQSEVLASKNEELAEKNKIIEKQIVEMGILIKKLQESNENLNQFAAVAAHDLKAPLRTIQAFSQIIYNKYATKFPEKDMELLKFVSNGCTVLRNLIDGLLNYSRIVSMDYQLEQVDLTTVVSDVEKNLNTSIEENKINIHIQHPLPNVTGQKSLLFQVLLNLINNAIKFRNTTASIQASIWIDAEAYEEDYVKISVKDNGIGIDPKYHQAIFVIFRKLHGSGTYEGSGIGLALCKKIIERFGGEIWLESAKNEGTTFFFTLKKSG